MNSENSPSKIPSSEHMVSRIPHSSYLFIKSMEFKKPMALGIINDGPNTIRRKNTLKIPALVKPGSYLEEMSKKENFQYQ
jgi:hypothetical protein